eukprot:36478-Eustigmatos_ZCMA.PRE.1
MTTTMLIAKNPVSVPPYISVCGHVSMHSCTLTLDPISAPKPVRTCHTVIQRPHHPPGQLRLGQRCPHLLIRVLSEWVQ